MVLSGLKKLPIILYCEIGDCIEGCERKSHQEDICLYAIVYVCVCVNVCACSCACQNTVLINPVGFFLKNYIAYGLVTSIGAY